MKPDDFSYYRLRSCGRPSTADNTDRVGITFVSSRPARSNSSRNSCSVRSLSAENEAAIVTLPEGVYCYQATASPASPPCPRRLDLPTRLTPCDGPCLSRFDRSFRAHPLAVRSHGLSRSSSSPKSPRPQNCPARANSAGAEKVRDPSSNALPIISDRLHTPNSHELQELRSAVDGLSDAE